MSEAFVLGSVRTPLGKRNGALANTRPDELMALTLRELVDRTSIDADEIEDVLVGCVNAIGEQGRNIARVASLAAGFPVSVPGVTMNRMCGSSQQALNFGAQAIMAGQQSLVIAGGVESMSRVPLGSDSQGVELSGAVTERHEIVSQGIAAQMIADHWSISREQMDELSTESHRRAAQAWDDGKFTDETFSVVANPAEYLLGRDGGDAVITADEGIRRTTTVEILGQLNPAYQEGGMVTAGNSSQITDGAAAVLLGDEATARRLGLEPQARIVATQVVGVDPVMMLHGVIDVTKQLLARVGMDASEIDLFEVNEAFASVVLAWQRELKVPFEKINVNGGAIALGHPTGCSGARLMTTLVHEMKRRGARYGVQAMCIGFGMATATLVEAP
ncbi:thiolase family protein [Agromyces bauzanensis]|uniref:Acetyl-CoA acyltransferase n=1 Tax=Agromyces bauzanensis TaxID=1308924 RepID=A0A917PTK9_9MICO|nr:thiolase family protein [Agromyces bauzanensis]GGJ91008.1 acetyl-CoA acyltransferase [Agromyces bauzanensis]